MEKNQGLCNNSTAFGISFAVASVANALLVTAKEKSPKVLALMKGFTGHHWITHCTIIILLFLVLGWVLSRTNAGKGVRVAPRVLTATVVGGVILGAAVIVGFYLIVG
jgi:hypothetical protein